MNISLEYFLAVAEEESISRAAERVMVSQQDMSNHIRRLEKQYGLLFERRPRFALTPAGEAVLATYRQVRLLEESLEDRLRDLREDTEGTIRLGMHIARARILVPPAAARFCREFPHVRLEVVHGDTAVLEDKLGQGTLHLFLGVDPEERPHFCFTPVGSETVYLVIAGALLDRCFPQGGAGDTIDETQLSRLPLIFSPTISKTQARITDFFRQHGSPPHFKSRRGTMTSSSGWRPRAWGPASAQLCTCGTSGTFWRGRSPFFGGCMFRI